MSTEPRLVSVTGERDEKAYQAAIKRAGRVLAEVPVTPRTPTEAGIAYVRDNGLRLRDGAARKVAALAGPVDEDALRALLKVPGDGAA